MSTQVTHYVMVGVDIGGFDWENPVHERFLISGPESNKFGIIHDGMNGEYTIAGWVIDGASEETGGLEMTDIDVLSLSNIIGRVEEWLLENEFEYEEEISLRVFSYWS